MCRCTTAWGTTSRPCSASWTLGVTLKRPSGAAHCQPLGCLRQCLHIGHVLHVTPALEAVLTFSCISRARGVIFFQIGMLGCQACAWKVSLHSCKF